MTAEDLSALKALAEKATPGPWWTGMHDGFSFTVEGPEADSHPVAQRLIRPDAKFIVALVNAWPALLARVEEAEGAKADAWDEAIALVKTKVGDDGLIDQHRLIRIFNPYRLKGADAPARQLRECTICGEKVPMSHATETWERLHNHEGSKADDE